MSHETQTFAWKENRISELSTKMPFPWFVYVYLSFFSSYLLIFPLSCNEMFHYLREGKKVTLQRRGRRHTTKSENYEITMHTPTTLIIKQRQFQFRPCTQLQASKTDSKSLLQAKRETFGKLTIDLGPLSKRSAPKRVLFFKTPINKVHLGPQKRSFSLVFRCWNLLGKLGTFLREGVGAERDRRENRKKPRRDG